MKTKIISLSVLLTSLTLFAQQRGDLAERFKQLDRNGDGEISADEAKGDPCLVRLFALGDTDHDGMLSMEEPRAGVRNRAARPDRPARPLPPPPAGVEQTAHTITVDGRERSFIVQAPKSPKGRLPVVFVFHGGGGRGENMLEKANFGPMVAREDLLVVYPSGWKGNWNDGRNAARIASQQEGVDDVKFTRVVVDELAKLHPVDRSRIFATGASNGGIFAVTWLSKPRTFSLPSRR